MDWPSQRAQEREAPAQVRCLPGVYARSSRRVGLAIGKHGGVATASDVVLMERALVLMERALRASVPIGRKY
jgi:hypothetical protein